MRRYRTGREENQHIEIIGYDREAGAAPAEVMTSRLYTDGGDTLSFTHEVDERGVTSWFGAKGSPGSFKARWVEGWLDLRLDHLTATRSREQAAQDSSARCLDGTRIR
jgi:hypothetical protein